MQIVKPNHNKVNQAKCKPNQTKTNQTRPKPINESYFSFDWVKFYRIQINQFKLNVKVNRMPTPSSTYSCIH